MSDSDKFDATSFGKIEKKPARKYWANEASKFTPWLAESINLLGEEIGMKLEVEEQESSVGSFRVDLLCKDEADRAVIIENQLEQTDHRHLGQLLTYAAGKDAAAVVWVAIAFTEEHRAALDWLNEKTGDDISFFGVQIEVWQIGDSAAAPKFEVVCKPNQWTKVMQKSGVMSEVQKLRFAFWTELHQYMNDNGGKVKPTTPRTDHWMGFSIGKAEFRMVALLNVRDDTVAVQLIIAHSENTRAYYEMLKEQKGEIQREIDAELEWKMEGKQGHISLRRKNCNIKEEKSHWARAHSWLHENLEKFDGAFRERIGKLNAEDWSPSDEDGENNGED